MNNEDTKINHSISKFDSIIFDLDGTLWDSTEEVVKSWKKIIDSCDKIKKPLTREDIVGVFGTKHSLIGKKLFPYLDDETIDALMVKCYEAENNLLREVGGTLYENLEEVLSFLANKIPLFIVSNCQKGYIEIFLEYNKLGKYFKDFECSGNTDLSKAQNIKLIVERNNLKSPAYVGDTMGDYTATKEANLPFIFAKYGFGDVETPDFVIEEFKDLKALI